jgi:hypothetical protein
MSETAAAAETKTKSAATVTIGCKLPAGLVLEVGYQKMVPEGKDGKMVPINERGDDYARFIIRGWNHHSYEMRKQLIETKSSAGVPHGMNTRPYLNRGVPKALWERWKSEHKNSWLLKNEILFEVASGDEASAALRVAESAKTPKIFEPIDSTKTIVPGVKPLEREEV